MGVELQREYLTKRGIFSVCDYEKLDANDKTRWHTPVIRVHSGVILACTRGTLLPRQLERDVGLLSQGLNTQRDTIFLLSGLDTVTSACGHVDWTRARQRFLLRSANGCEWVRRIASLNRIADTHGELVLVLTD
jgi:hypothetical protein